MTNPIGSADAATLLGTSRQRVHQLAQLGKFGPARLVGGTLVLDRAAVERAAGRPIGETAAA